MASAGLDIDRETFRCSICLDFLNNPATIPCGHSYCISCIKTHWDAEVGRSCSCPQCRQGFTQRPVLVKNTMLAILMEGFQKVEPPAAPPVSAPSPPAPSHPAAPRVHVCCDLCFGEVKAVKSCLQCLVSYCKEHVKPHFDVAALKKHKLVKPTENLQDNLCSQHNEVKKMFCRTDQQCICYLCSVEQHKGHNAVTAAAERAEKQRELHAITQSLCQRIEHKERFLEGLQHHVKDCARSAKEAAEQTDKGLKELHCLLEERLREVKLQVTSQHNAERLRVNDLQVKEQQTVKELRKKVSALNTLSLTEDHVHFLLKFGSLSKVSETSDLVKSSQAPPPFKDTVTAAVSKLRRTLQEARLVDPAAEVHEPKGNTALGAEGEGTAEADSPKGELCIILLPPAELTETPQTPPQNPKRRKPDYAAAVNHHNDKTVHDSPRKSQKADAPPAPDPSQFTLAPPPLPPRPEQWPALTVESQRDSDWAWHIGYVPLNCYWQMRQYRDEVEWDFQSLNYNLKLTKKSTVVEYMSQPQKYPEGRFRFTEHPQVISKWGMYNGYFEVKGSSFTIAVTERSIKREGSSWESAFGMNTKSWALECYPDHCEYVHNRDRVSIPIPGILTGVYVNEKEGIVSFYRQNTKLELVHTLGVRLEEPRAGLRLHKVGDKVEICHRMFSDGY